MGPISKGPSGRNLSSEEEAKLLKQLQESERRGSSSSPIGMSGRNLSSFDLRASPRIILRGRLGVPSGMDLQAYSRSRSWVWWIAGIVVAAVAIAGIWWLVHRFV